jgi:hypothetical protein
MNEVTNCCYMWYETDVMNFGYLALGRMCSYYLGLHSRHKVCLIPFPKRPAA